MQNFKEVITLCQDLICNECSCPDCQHCPWAIEQAIEEVGKYVVI
jgi:hypothetical protein